VFSKVGRKILVSFRLIQNFKILDLAMVKVKKVNIAATYFGSDAPNGGVTLVTIITYDSRVINYNHNHVYSTGHSDYSSKL
jgi:hypothetical protein